MSGTDGNIHDDEVTIDPHVAPWSFAGSYLCLATRAGRLGKLTHNTDICLVSHVHAAGLPLFTLRPTPPDVLGSLPPPNGFPKDPSPTRLTATPSRLTWRSKETGEDTPVAEAVFQDERTVRLRGSWPLVMDTEGSLAVDQWRCWLFRVPNYIGKAGDMPQVEFTSTPDTAFRIAALEGSMELFNDAPSKNENRRIVIRPNPNSKVWEIAIVERPKAPERVNIMSPTIEDCLEAAFGLPFDQCEERTASTFDAYACSLIPWQSLDASQRRLDRYASYVMWASTVRSAGYFMRESILMSKLWMNKVWSWDNCFNCLALCMKSSEAALGQMMVPFDHITAEGRLPDSMCHSEILFDYTKPPIYGWTVDMLLELLHSYPSDPMHKNAEPFARLPRDVLQDLFTKVELFTKFWFAYRSTSVSKIPWYSHGNDSGWDNSTAYDKQTVCVSPDLGALLVSQTDLLVRLASFLGLEEAKQWKITRDETLHALLSELWDEKNGTFLFKDAVSGETWTSDTLLKYIPLASAHHLPPKIVKTLAARLEKEHLTEWGLATEAPDSKLYESDGYWRGPIWAPATILIESGLRQAGHTALADTIVQRYIKLCDTSGFAENFDAVKGVGYRDLAYTWTASTYLVLRSQQAARAKS